MFKITAKLLVALCLFSPLTLANETEFEITLSLLKPIQVQEIRSMSFGTVLGGFNSEVIISPHSVNAATFRATGIPWTSVTGSVIEPEVWLTKVKGNGNGKGNKKDRIRVSNFTFGGEMNHEGHANFWHDGILSSLRVGATARISADNTSGIYRGSATFRITYL